jgi:hypothetical protein
MLIVLFAWVDQAEKGQASEIYSTIGKKRKFLKHFSPRT